MINKVILIGRVGKDVELKYSQGGMAMANASLATSKKYTDKQGHKHDKTTWHFCKFFGKSAEVVSQYVKKGDQLYVEGEIEVSAFTGNDGLEKTVTQILVNQFQMLGGKKQDAVPADNNSFTPEDAPF